MGLLQAWRSYPGKTKMGKTMENLIVAILWKPQLVAKLAISMGKTRMIGMKRRKPHSMAIIMGKMMMKHGME